MRTEFNRALNDLRDDILLMASRVEHELDAALTALADVDIEKAREVYAADRIVNQNRFDIEDRCFALIATQQPAAGDLRLVVAAMSMVVDIERMGDQAKGIAKVVTHLYERTTIPRPPELVEMGKMVRDMLRRAMQAYAEGNIVLAQTVANTDEDVDHLYGQVFAQMMDYMAAHGSKRSRPAELVPGTLRVISLRMDYLPLSIIAKTRIGLAMQYISGFEQRVALHAADAGFDDQLIYDELPLPYSERRIHTEHLLREEAQADYETRYGGELR